MAADGNAPAGSMLLPAAGLLIIVAVLVAPSFFLVVAIALVVVAGGAAVFKQPGCAEGISAQPAEVPPSQSSTCMPPVPSKGESSPEADTGPGDAQHPRSSEPASLGDAATAMSSSRAGSSREFQIADTNGSKFSVGLSAAAAMGNGVPDGTQPPQIKGHLPSDQAAARGRPMSSSTAAAPNDVAQEKEPMAANPAAPSSAAASRPAAGGAAILARLK